MDVALAVLLLWALLFVPVGLLLHWVVLGPGARERALPLAPVTGVAVAFVALGALARAGVDAGDRWVPWTVAALAVASALAVWRLDAPWRSRELLGATALVLFAVFLVQLPVVGADGDGPLGYGTAVDPVVEVAAIEAASKGPAADLGVAVQARSTADERAVGFEQFAALTVALGRDESASLEDATWSGYGLHSAITGVLAALVTLPLFGFARARGMRWFGLLVLVPLGVLAPAVFLALANGAGAAIAAVPFFTAAVFSLLVTRRDRGWWALFVLFAAATAATAGALALLPLVTTAAAWMFLRSDTYEHLSQVDAPVSRARTLAVTVGAGACGVVAAVPTLVAGGSPLAWEQLRLDASDALRSWPFSWLDSGLSAAGPTGVLETAVWLIGPALLLIAFGYALERNERRELAVIVGTVASALFAAVVMLADRDAGIALLEYCLLVTSPFLAALAIRGVALARAGAESTPGGAWRTRWRRLGPTIVLVSFALLSLSATSVTGTRMVHAPALGLGAPTAGAADAAAPAQGQDRVAASDTLIAAGDPWLAFVLDGERVTGGYADADALVASDRDLSARSILEGVGYAQLVLGNGPLASDPPLRYAETIDLDSYGARRFVDRLGDGPQADAASIAELDLEVRAQRSRAANEGRGPSGSDPATPSDEPVPPTDDATDGRPETGSTGAPSAAQDAAAASVDAARAAQAVDTTDIVAATPLRHVPVERRDAGPADAAGQLLPAAPLDACPEQRREAETTCDPIEPELGEDCDPADATAVESAGIAPDDRRDRDRGAPRDRAARVSPFGVAGVVTPVLEVDADADLLEDPPLLAVACLEVPLERDAGVLVLHVRNVGLVLTPERAIASGEWASRELPSRDGGPFRGATRRTTSSLGAGLEFGRGRLLGAHELTVEGSFGAGVDLVAGLGGVAPLPGEDAESLPERQQAFANRRGASNGFAQVVRSALLSGTVEVVNSSGTDIEIGRLFARPRDLPRSCDIAVPLTPGAQRELHVNGPARPSEDPIERPGISVVVRSVDERAGQRVARIAVGTYLTRAGLPRHLLLDWTAQYAGSVTIEECDGVARSTDGPTLPVDVIIN